MNRPGYMPRRGRTPSRTPPRGGSYTAEPGASSLVVYPHNAAEWAKEFPALAAAGKVPVYGWVFDTALPIVDGWGGVDVDSSAGDIVLEAAYKGRGGGACVEHSGNTLDEVSSSSNLAWPAGGAGAPWAMLVSWWRQGEVGSGSNHVVVAARNGTAEGVLVYQRANATQNWLFPASEEVLGTSYATILTNTADPGDPTYGTGYDTLYTRDGAAIDAWLWGDFAPANALHEDNVCGASESFNTAQPLNVLGHSSANGVIGCQVKAVYLFHVALTRDDGDVYRRATTATQDEL